MARILITGAGGFLGYHLANLLLAEGNDLVCIDNFSRIPKDSHVLDLMANQRVEWYEESIEQLNLTGIFSEPFEYIYHLATINGTDNFYKQPFEVIFSVVVPTLHLLREILKQQILPKRFFLASTSEVYASMTELGVSEIPTSENTPIGIDDVRNPRWSYAAGKIAAESALISAAEEHGFEWLIGRYHNVYGPRMGNKHFIPDFISRLKQREYFYFGADQTRSFTYISDAISQTVSHMSHLNSANKIINIGSSNETQVREVAKVILDLMNLEGQACEEFPAPKGSVNRRVPSLDLARQILGEMSFVPLEQGLRETVKWYEEHEF